MSSSKNFYNRIFVVLHEEDQDFGMVQGRKPAGSCKLELKDKAGKLNITVQGLKTSGEGTYIGVLVSKNEERILVYQCGTLSVNTRGFGELSMNFDAENVGGLNISEYQTICVAYIAGLTDKPGNIQLPLVGNAKKNTRFTWKMETRAAVSSLMFGPAETEARIEPSAVIALPAALIEIEEKVNENKDEDENEDENKNNKENKDENENENNKENKAVNTKENQKEIEIVKEQVEAENIEIVQKKESEEVEQAEQQEQVEQQNKVEQQNRAAKNTNVTKSYWEKTKGYYDSLFEAQPSVQPFYQLIPHSEWIRVGSGYYPSMEQTNWYIVGIITVEDRVRYICYGIPAPYTLLPPAGLKGFIRWLPAGDTYGLGYWLLYLDADTGETVYPYI